MPDKTTTAIFLCQWDVSYHDLVLNKKPYTAFVRIDNWYSYGGSGTPHEVPIEWYLRNNVLIEYPEYEIVNIAIVGKIGYVRGNWHDFVVDFDIWEKTTVGFTTVTSNLKYFFRGILHDHSPAREVDLRAYRDFAIELRENPKLKAKIKVSKAILARYLSLWEEDKEA